jgi:pimeloyl-ACP methyl ester carboxylesterase
MPRIEIYGSGFEVHEQGSGEPVVLLHASGSSNAQWRALIEQLSPRYRVIAPDLYGYGASANWPGRGVFCLGHEAAVVRALLDRIDEPSHLVGHSYGGAVALNVARSRGELLRSLTVIEPAAFHLLREGDETDAAALREISAIADTVAHALACGEYTAGFGRFVDYWSGPGAWAGIPAAKRDALAARLSKVALDFHATLNEPTRLEDFGALTVATLVVQGACSPLPTRRICERLAAVLPEAQSKTIEGAGHMAPVTHRDEVNCLIAAHLAENAAKRRRTGSPHNPNPESKHDCNRAGVASAVEQLAA